MFLIRIFGYLALACLTLATPVHDMDAEAKQAFRDVQRFYYETDTNQALIEIAHRMRESPTFHIMIDHAVNALAPEHASSETLDNRRRHWYTTFSQPRTVRSVLSYGRVAAMDFHQRVELATVTKDGVDRLCRDMLSQAASSFSKRLVSDLQLATLPKVRVPSGLVRRATADLTPMEEKVFGFSTQYMNFAFGLAAVVSISKTARMLMAKVPFLKKLPLYSHGAHAPWPLQQTWSDMALFGGVVVFSLFCTWAWSTYSGFIEGRQRKVDAAYLAEQRQIELEEAREAAHQRKRSRHRISRHFKPQDTPSPQNSDVLYESDS
ncbi:hypothetical protein CXG81DRAFT_21555 [Caulochytrium protostelioides]|uniref:Uncharacterized protein n=1 Tax=Caulochytrium protostelioides TaxID=1555241 RepID=A0A4P9WXW3_9FUNG|nr:hypothetical protein CAUPRSCDRAFT_12165 [Caulochytrium protostelioides]RKO98199.1 hypothetical protein CXG81DRAFT_21555 [Caulochytrium protostelioides]|eukprot:RKO98199.1 hypothetical protein CXG81DRAFT_21555 [Caulochytrium protostelioides]